MTPLAGHIVLALGDMAARPLARYLRTLGASLIEDSDMIADASFLIDDLGLEELADRGWTRAKIESENRGLVHVSVSPFGSGGPRSRWRGGELVASAMGGTLRLTGSPDRAPVKEALDACTFHADMVAGAGAMAAHYARGRSGLGQHVDVSIQEVALSRNVNGILVWQFDRRKLHRVGGALNYGKATVRCIWKLADGWCFHSLMTGRFGAPANQALSDWMDERRVRNPLRGVDWLKYNRSTLDPLTRADWESAIAEFFEILTKADVGTEGRKRGINACVVAEPSDVLAAEHLKARKFWAAQDNIDVPSRFALLSEGTRSEGSTENTSNRSGPLAGVRVLDFSWALVGSITTKILGDLGADVVKIESRSRPCLSRLDVQVSASRADNMDDKPWFAHLNSSKRSLALDMKRPESRELLDPLIDWADVVVENFSPGTMAKLGLDYDALSQRRPGLIMASGSVYGQTGPLAKEWGVDGTGGALSGRTFLTGWADRDPVVPGAVPYGDVIVPFVMASAIAMALQRRRECGVGMYIDASMYEICVQQMHQAILDAQLNNTPQRVGNADPKVLFQDVFPAHGEDRWVAISCFNEADLARLTEIVGGDDIAAWTRVRQDLEAVEFLQDAGISAGVVQDIEDLLEHDPQVAARGSLVQLGHLHLGPFGHVRTPIDFSRDTPEPFRAPGLGEHNREIGCGIAGLSEERVKELQSLGVLQ
jgi:crotonobetainyl-CoA:carnitine CoA-transferase CaiB-like acyl-CoA transferase